MALHNGRNRGDGGGQASGVSYDNGTSGLTATNVQSAIDEVYEFISSGQALPHVTNFAALPSASSHTGGYYIVDTSTGVWLVNRKSAGIYKSDGIAWTWISDAPQSLPEMDGSITDTQHGELTGGSLHALATDSANGFMSKEDKEYLSTTLPGVLDTKLDVPGSPNTNDLLKYNGSAWIAAPRYSYFFMLTSAYSSTSTTPASVTDWSFSVTSGKCYRIQVIGNYQTNNTATGIVLGTTMTTATGNCSGFIEASQTNTGTSEIKTTYSSTGVSLNSTQAAALNTATPFKYDMIFDCTASGTFAINMASEVGGNTAQINATSVLLVELLN